MLHAFAAPPLQSKIRKNRKLNLTNIPRQADDEMRFN